MEIFKNARLRAKIVFILVFSILLISTIIPSFLDELKDSSPSFIIILILLFTLGIVSSMLLAIGISLLFNRVISKNAFKFDSELLAGIFSFILFLPIVFKFPENYVRVWVLIISPLTNILLTLLFVKWLYVIKSLSKILVIAYGCVVVFSNQINFFGFLNRFFIWRGEDASSFSVLLFILVPIAIPTIYFYLRNLGKRSGNE